MSEITNQPSKDEILAAITAGVTAAMPSPDEIWAAISGAVSTSMPWPSEILGAIEDGAREGMKSQEAVAK